MCCQLRWRFVIEITPHYSHCFLTTQVQYQLLSQALYVRFKSLCFGGRCFLVTTLILTLRLDKDNGDTFSRWIDTVSKAFLYELYSQVDSETNKVRWCISAVMSHYGKYHIISAMEDEGEEEYVVHQREADGVQRSASALSNHFRWRARWPLRWRYDRCILTSSRGNWCI